MSSKPVPQAFFGYKSCIQTLPEPLQPRGLTEDHKNQLPVRLLELAVKMKLSFKACMTALALTGYSHGW